MLILRLVERASICRRPMGVNTPFLRFDF